MNFEEWANLNEELTLLTPTQKVNRVSRVDFGEESSLVFRTWAKSYDKIGIGTSGLSKRISETLDIDEDSIETLVQVSGGLPEFLEEWSGVNESDISSDISISTALSCLYQDSSEDAYEVFFNSFNGLSSIGRKWITAYLLMKPRNGIGESEVKKMLSKKFSIKASDIKRAACFLNIQEIITQLHDTGELVYSPTIGKFMTPMLAKGGQFNVSSKCLVDYKYDGIRAQFHIGPNHELTIFNRKGDDVTDKYLDIGFDVATTCDNKGWILDGEIYPVHEDGSPAEFKLMMSRIHGKDKNKIYRSKVTARLFDVLYYDGQAVFDWPYLKRNDLLNTLEHYVAEQTEISTQEEMLNFYHKAINEGFEGVIVKSLNTPYEFGKRSRAWMKFKPPMIDLDVVVTNANMGSGKRAGLYGSFDIAITDGTELIPFGSVGTGFTDSDLKMMTSLYNQEGANQIIIEVKGDMITQNEQGEYGLRFPVFVKYRDDKDSPTNINELNI